MKTAITGLTESEPMMQPWTATINDDGKVTLAPDTHETRAAFHETMRGIFGGRYEGIRTVPVEYKMHPNWDPGFEGTP